MSSAEVTKAAATAMWVQGQNYRNSLFSVFKICGKANDLHNMEEKCFNNDAKGNCEILTGIADIQCLYKGNVWTFILLIC